MTSDMANAPGHRLGVEDVFPPTPVSRRQGTSPVRKMTIAKLARAGGVGVETIRYYQRRGLTPTPAPIFDSPYRHNDQGHLQRLRFIRRAQAAGFTLEEIRELLRVDRCGDRTRIRELAAKRLDSLAAQMADLKRSRQSLERLLRDCRHSGRGPCPIVEAFDPRGE